MAVRGPTELEGNLKQLLVMIASDCDIDVREWLNGEEIHVS